MSALQQNLFEPPQLVHDSPVAFEAADPNDVAAVELPPIGTKVLLDVVCGGLALTYSRVRLEAAADLEPFAFMRMGQVCAKFATSGTNNCVAELTLEFDSVQLEDRRYILYGIF